MRVRPLRVLVLGPVLLAVLAVPAGRVPAVSSGAQAACRAPADARMVQRDGRAVLFVLRDDAEEAQELWGCVRGRSRPRVLGEAYAAGSTAEELSQVRLARSRFAYVRVISSAHEPGLRSQVVTGSLAGRIRRATTSIGQCRATELRLGAEGGVAWRQDGAVAVADGRGRRIADPGPVERGSLVLGASGRRIAWRAGGQTRSLLLGRRARGEGRLDGPSCR